MVRVIHGDILELMLPVEIRTVVMAPRHGPLALGLTGILRAMVPWLTATRTFFDRPAAVAPDGSHTWHALVGAVTRDLFVVRRLVLALRAAYWFGIAVEA